MENKDKLNKLIQKCKCGVYIAINSHRDYYETVEQHFKQNLINQEELEGIDNDIYEKMKETNTMIELQYYPHTPIGFYKVYHYDLEMAIDEALYSLNIT
jgi:hypothetical protein